MSAISGHSALRVTRRDAGLLGGLILVELAFVIVWFAVADWSVLRPLAVAHPLVWLNVSAFAALVVDRPDSPPRQTMVVAGIGVVYFGVVSWIGGLLRHGMGGLDASILWLPPGWGPAIHVTSPWLGATLFPYQVVGYLTLAYLLYIAVLSAIQPVAGAVLGLTSCIGCTLPLAASLSAPLIGGTLPLALGEAGRPAAIGTIVFVLSVALLLWRPPE